MWLKPQLANGDNMPIFFPPCEWKNKNSNQPKRHIQKGGKTAMKSTATSQTFSNFFFKTRQAALTFRTGHYYQSSVNKHSIGEMLRHTNTGGVSVLYITHFGRERQRGIAAKETQAQGKTKKSVSYFSHVFIFTFNVDPQDDKGRTSAALPSLAVPG